jgi:hypothetical protein
MSSLLNKIVNNDNPNDRIHAYIFVYDASKKATFETLLCLIDTIKEIEKSQRRGKKQMAY